MKIRTPLRLDGRYRSRRCGVEELVWQGIASRTLASNPEKSEKRINKVVKKLFKKFPVSADD